MMLPLVGFHRLENLSRKRTINDGANLLQRRCLASRQYLNRNIAKRCSLSWTSKHPSAGGIGRELIQESVPRATTNNSNLFHAPPAYLFKIAKGQSVLHRQTLQNASYIRAGIRWRWLMRLGAELIDCNQHVLRMEKRLVIRVNKMCERRFTIG